MVAPPEQPLTFIPGQYATLGAQDGYHVVERPYSIVSSPLEEEIEFFLELPPRGGLTPILHEMRVGETLLMRRQARGCSTFDHDSGHPPHLLVGTVTGLAPYVSLVRTFARQGLRNPQLRAIVLHSASRSWEFGYRKELEALAKDSDWLIYVPTVSRP